MGDLRIFPNGETTAKLNTLLYFTFIASFFLFFFCGVTSNKYFLFRRFSPLTAPGAQSRARARARARSGLRVLSR